MAQSMRAPCTARQSTTCFRSRRINAQRAVTVRRAPTVRVAAQEAPTAAENAQKTYYALVANAEFFFNDVQNESFAEQLRERTRLFKERNEARDFYLIPNPTWLDAKYPAEAKKVKRPCVALVSADKLWITFMKLRLDRVLKFELSGVSEAEVLQMGEPLGEFSTPLGQSKWTAPYSPYSPGWWEVFYPTNK